jgi:hypothetical protein
MLSFDDQRWRSLAGGYRVPYDPTPMLRRLAADWSDGEAWAELWGELHHQGDVGEASYAAVPALVEVARRVRARGWNFYGLAATIELERHRRTNPSLPDWLAPDYRRAWDELLTLALADLREPVDPLVAQTALSVVALARAPIRLGALIAHLDESELEELTEEYLYWSTLYRSGSGPPAPGAPAASRPAG